MSVFLDHSFVTGIYFAYLNTFFDVAQHSFKQEFKDWQYKKEQITKKEWLKAFSWQKNL